MGSVGNGGSWGSRGEAFGLGAITVLGPRRLPPPLPRWASPGGPPPQGGRPPKGGVGGGPRAPGRWWWRRGVGGAPQAPKFLWSVHKLFFRRPLWPVRRVCTGPSRLWQARLGQGKAFEEWLARARGRRSRERPRPWVRGRSISEGDALDGSLAGSVASDGRGWVRLPREPWPVDCCSSARTLTLGKVAGGDPGEGHVPPHLARGPAGGLGSRGAAGARGDWAIKAPPAAKGPGTAGPRGVGGAPGRGDGSQRIHMYVTCPCRTRLAHTDVARDRHGAQGTHGHAFGGATAATAAARALEPRRGASQGAPEAWGSWGGGGRGVRPWGAVWFSRVDF